MIIDEEKFLNFEKKNNLFDLNVDKFFYWGIIRLDIFSLLQHVDISIKENRMPKFEKLYKKVFRIFTSFFYSPLHINCPNKLIFLSSSPLNKFFEKYLCRFTDLIIDKFNNDSLVISDYYESNNNRYRKVYYNFELTRVKYNVVYFLFYYFSTGKKIFIDHAIHLTNILNDEFNTNINYIIILKLICKFKCAHKYIYKDYYKLLSRLTPKCIVYQCYYSYEHMMINEIANDLGIDTIELQHGVLNQYHIAYNYKADNCSRYLPKKIFFWGEYWKKSCNIPIAENNKIVTGFPYYDTQVSFYPKVKSNGIIRILVLSQKDIASQFVKIFDELLIRLENNSSIKYSIIYKLHPDEFLNDKSLYYNIIRHKNVTFIDNLDTSLYYCFANSDIQISECSTALFEGIHYNLKTFVYDSLLGRKYMKVLSDNFDAKYFCNANELYYLINKKVLVDNQIDTNYFFKEKSLNNISNELNKYYV